MPTILERIAAKIAYHHARSVYARFEKALRRPAEVQAETLARVLEHLAPGEYTRRYRLDAVRKPADFRKAAPIVTYEDVRTYVDRVATGETAALFHPRETIHMFATSSGTTAQQKLIPVTTEFINQYRRGWNIFGLKMLSDHPAAILRPILQVSGRYDERRSSAGIPCGAITGLLARTQKGIVRRFYVGHPEIASIPDPAAKYYALMRFAVVRDVAFAITANPATLIRMAQVVNDESERLIRDVRDGTLSSEIVPDRGLRERLAAGLRPNPVRAAELERARSIHKILRPRDIWNLTFLACWTGGSMGQYRTRLSQWWGEIPVRDIGLLASEGRVTIPLSDIKPAGVLDTNAGYFEFIPLDRWEQPDADVLSVEELEVGGEYVVVLTNHSGLIRYRLDDVVRVTERLFETPVLEFLYRAGRVSSVSGEKLTENQVVEAVRSATAKLGLQEFDFLLAPQWSDPPFYQLYCSIRDNRQLVREIDAALSQINEEYGSRRNTLRLNELKIEYISSSAFQSLDRVLAAKRGSTSEQYKRPCLLTTCGEDVKLLSEIA